MWETATTGSLMCPARFTIAHPHPPGRSLRLVQRRNLRLRGTCHFWTFSPSFALCVFQVVLLQDTRDPVSLNHR